MAEKQKAIYEPGELSRVREKLGAFDEKEAKRMVQILGGEVGREKNADAGGQAAAKKTSHIKRDTVELRVSGQRRKRPVPRGEFAGDNAGSSRQALVGLPDGDPADDPSVHLKTSYFERIKIDRYAAQYEFEIKSTLQVLASIVSFFREPEDYVNPRFVSRHINEFYSKIEQLVSATRGLLPRNNARRAERLKKTSPFVYTVMETIRHWNIERIEGDLAKLQAHPRSVKVSDFADILRAIYKPLFILERLNMDIHVKGAFKLLYKLLYIENPMEPRAKNQDLIRIALASFTEIRTDVHFGLYPLLMKFISDRWLPYERLFIERRRRLMAFLEVTENDQLPPIDMSPDKAESGNLEAVREEIQKEQEAAERIQNSDEDEDPEDPAVIERKAKAAAEEAERKALNHSLGVLEALFPEAGWERLHEYPDLYPYFANLYGLRRGYELIAPNDPLQQIAVLMYILEDICAGLRYVTFGTVTGPDGTLVNVHSMIGNTITGWRRYIDESFTKEFLPRLTDYCRILDNSTESRTSVYAKRTLNELYWTKRLYFLPYYKFESLGPPPFQKQDITAIYGEARIFRKFLTQIAAGIEQGNHDGGAEANARCEGIENPWAKYNFEIPNPVSKRLDALLGPGKRNNTALVFFALSAVTVLDYLINNESSWAYGEHIKVMFRSVNDEGIKPQFGIDKKINADQIFKNSLKRGKDG